MSVPPGTVALLLVAAYLALIVVGLCVAVS